MRATGTYVEALITALATETGIKFIDGNGWETDIEKRTLTYNGFTLRQMEISDVKGYLLHEMGHILHTKVKVAQPLLKEYPTLQSVYNVAEDARTDRLIYDKYGEFAAEALSNRYTWDFEEVNNLLKNPEKAAEISDLNKVLIYWLSRLQEQGGFINTYNNIEHTMAAYAHNKRAWDYISKLNKVRTINEWYELIISKNSTDGIVKLVDKEIFPIIKDLLEEDNKKMGEDGTQSTHGICKTAGGEEKEESEESSKGDKEKTKGDQQANHNNHGPSIREGNELYEPRKIPEDWELDALTSHYTRVLTQRISDILKERATTRYSGSKKRGKLLAKNTYKILTDDKRPFSKRLNPDKPHYHLTFILDESGSMSGNSRHYYTYVASHMLDKVAKNLKFDITYVAYDDEPRILKDLRGYKKMRGGGNEDEDVIRFVGDKLNYEDDNLIFMMTDGGVCSEPRKAIEELTKKGVALVAVGIGIDGSETEVMKRHYPDYVSVPDLEQLPRALVMTMKRMIHR